MTTPAIPPVRPAATVVVLRPAAHAPFEVLLVRRNDSVAFMAGAHVFPGGRVDDTDLPDPPAACDGLADVGRCTDLAPADEARFRVAAIRELLEEAGLLLARRDGAFVDHATAKALRALTSPEAPFVAQLAAQGFTIALDAVMPFAHWVTPEIEIRRFDARFMMARVPGQQQASHDAGETTALDWLTPGAALDRARRDEILLPPPTWSTLTRLSAFASIDEAWQWAATTPMPRIQPRVLRQGDTATFTLPGHPTFPPLPDTEPFADTHFELVGGRWRPIPP